MKNFTPNRFSYFGRPSHSDHCCDYYFGYYGDVRIIIALIIYLEALHILAGIITWLTSQAG